MNNFIADIYKPIKNFGYLSIFLGAYGFLALFTIPDGADHIEITLYWSVFFPLSVYHLIMGIKLVLKRKWGVILLKAYLHIIYLGFPIGTYLAKKGWRYIDENNIMIYLK